MEDDLGNSDLDVNGEIPVSDGVARWVPAVVVIGSVVGFVALAWYAYHAGTQSLSDDSVMVVEADKTPEKEKPVDPGGMKFPDQDKTIFDTFSASNGTPPKVERVLPPPEEPLPKQMDTSGTTTWVNQNSNPPAKPEQVMAANDSKPAPAPVAAAKAPEPAPDAKPTPVDGTITSYSAPKSVAKSDTKPAAKPDVKPAASASAKVQLGAYRSEKEASDAFAALQKKFSSLADKSPVIIKADLGEKGIYYRLRVGVSDAKGFCGALTAKGQACIPVE